MYPTCSLYWNFLYIHIASPFPSASTLLTLNTRCVVAVVVAVVVAIVVVF